MAEFFDQPLESCYILPTSNNEERFIGFTSLYTFPP